MNSETERPTLTNRRSFLRVVGGVGLTSAMAPGYIMGAKPKAANGVLIEASNFTNLGGWKLDTQHYQQMGGVYLLAHGMGKPVANASTKVNIPEAGTWHVWVRNRDWCQGDWKSPGRFRVHVNGKALKIPAISPKLSETPGRTDWPGVHIGAHNHEVLIDLLGMSEEKIAELKSDGVIS